VQFHFPRTVQLHAQSVSQLEYEQLSPAEQAPKPYSFASQSLHHSRPNWHVQ
jgi:hypothetical protein